MSTEIYFKVITANRKSTFARGKFTREYPVGKWVRPYKGTRLFLFKNYKSAARYGRDCVCSSHDWKIVRCQAKGVKDAPRLVLTADLLGNERLVKYWKVALKNPLLDWDDVAASFPHYDGMAGNPGWADAITATHICCLE